MRISPHLNFNGQCREAFKLYQSVLGGTIQTMLSYGDSPLAADYDPRWHDRILHATLALGDQELMGTDQLPHTFQAPRGIMITLSIPGLVEGRRVFDALAEGGAVTLPFQSLFWTPGFGVVIDRYGISWEVNVDTSSA